MTSNPVTRRAARALAALLGPTRTQRVAELLVAHIPPSRTVRVGGPYPVSVRRTGLGVELDHHSLMTALLTGLAVDFAEDEDGVAFQLTEIAAASGPERDELLLKLLDSLGGAGQRLSSRGALDLVEKIRAAAGPTFPHQQDRRHAA